MQLRLVRHLVFGEGMLVRFARVLMFIVLNIKCMEKAMNVVLRRGQFKLFVLIFRLLLKITVDWPFNAIS